MIHQAHTITAESMEHLREDLTQLANSMNETTMKANEMLSHPWFLRFIRNETDKSIIAKLNGDISHAMSLFSVSGTAKIQTDLVMIQQTIKSERQRAERERQKAEQERQRSEEERRKAEKERLKAEEGRQKAEQERQKAEEERQKAELERKRAEEREQEALIQALPRAEATFDLGVWGVMSACYEGTRRTTLKRVDDWLDNADAPPVFWLYGCPGLGKTAIAKSVASYTRERGDLAANFFFSVRIGSGCSDGRLLFPSLARQLASYDPSFKASLAAALNMDRDVAHRPIDVQFRALFYRPFLAMNKGSVRPVIVLDGLDECADHGLMQDILRQLISLALEFPTQLKLLLTSRREHHITTILQEAPATCRISFDLQQLEQHHASHDIEVYLIHDLNRSATIKGWYTPWPSREEIKRLVDLADGLFIFASTVARFVEGAWQSSSDTLNVLLRAEERAKVLTPIDSLYQSILDNAIPSSEHKPGTFTRYLRDILTIEVSLHTAAGSYERYVWKPVVWSWWDWCLALGIDRPLLYEVLRPLHSVLCVPPITTSKRQYKYIRTYHRSFLEFVSDGQRCNKQFAVTLQAAEELSTRLFNVWNATILNATHPEPPKSRSREPSWSLERSILMQCYSVLSYYVEKAVPQIAAQYGCMDRWPPQLIASVRCCFEERMPAFWKLVVASEKGLSKFPTFVQSMNGIGFLSCSYMYWYWRGSDPLGGQHNNLVTNSRAILRYCNQLIQMDLPRTVLHSIFSVINGGMLRFSAQKHDDVSPLPKIYFEDLCSEFHLHPLLKSIGEDPFMSNWANKQIEIMARTFPTGEPEHKAYLEVW
ncbi:hypothetical protein K474DRAFT_57199 [Panus rudis PR-1116 ss-1]|nr:hypothetical protein K474DRAFT_57199 [Panus rudis PR-1116 ss-1]